MVAAVAGMVGGSVAAVSALYGALVVVLPGALMARGTTSPTVPLSAATSAISMLVWAGVKMGASVLMLVLAPRIVQPLSWPALLVGDGGVHAVYWFALLWRGRSKN